MDPNWITPEEQVDIINKMVHKNDTLILLGDVGNTEWVKKLKAGYKVLITGNHDAGAENYKRINYQTMGNNSDLIEQFKNLGCEVQVQYLEDSNFFKIKADNHLFDEVYTGPLMIADKIILSHEPIPNIDWALNIHGHNHSGGNNDTYHYNVCSNVIGYKPVNLKDIINSGTLKNIESLHRQIINEATERRK